MKNKRLERFLVKTSISAIAGAILGGIYMMEQKQQERVNKKYEEEHGIESKKLI